MSGTFLITVAYLFIQIIDNQVVFIEDHIQEFLPKHIGKRILEETENHIFFINL